MSVELGWQFFLNGLAAGGMYAMLAAGLIVAYRASGFLNFAHPYVGMLAAYVYVLAMPALGAGPALVVAVAAGAALGGLLYRGVFARVADQPMGAKVVVALATGIGLQVVGGVLFLNFDLLNRDRGSVLPDGAGPVLLGGRITWQQLGLPLSAALVVGGLLWLLHRTDFGLALRATAQNPLSAGLAGVPRRAVEVGAWALAGGLAGLAGVMWLSRSSFLVPTYLFDETIRGFAAALAGGFVDLRRAAAAALALGVVEQELVGAPAPWSEMPGAVSFALITVVAVVGLSSRRLALERAE